VPVGVGVGEGLKSINIGSPPLKSADVGDTCSNVSGAVYWIKNLPEFIL
jgi:hypothetical protein